MPNRLLFLEGSSLTSRETLTVLLKSGYKIDVLSPSRFPIAAFSRLTHRIPTVDVNRFPTDYLKQVQQLLDQKTYTAILPTHEEGWLLANGKPFLPAFLPIALADKEQFEKLAGKIAFAETADRLGLPIPKWEQVKDADSIRLDYPYWLKADYGTAGRSVYQISNQDDLLQAAELLSANDERWMVQQDIAGDYGQVQAVFDHGRLLAVHTSLKAGAGAGGSAAARLSIASEETREHAEKLGRFLKWHGSLTLDFIRREGQFYYIECNPRMVEPANAYKAGVHFPKIMIDLATHSYAEPEVRLGQAGIQTHSLMALIIGTAERTKSRIKILQTIRQWLWKSDSQEVLMPVWQDFPSFIPLATVTLRLLINPKSVKHLVDQTVKHYSVEPATVKNIEQKI
ncbi:ATP-grasp domain-containing protein [Streptococcus panodentis]|uniref:Carboxylate--amine ligase n=1 Tax=Streptococcus panodentis TaxID=1581472 RepID=A0ABS5AWK8_9STRE|nr:ATP-grasp domain-containing protein [Streptococcus panodentis]MBP2620969.1 carboxylate--amine ligase [Streptococcus panodentis]